MVCEILNSSIKPSKESTIRNDIAYILTTRLINYLSTNIDYAYTQSDLENIANFVKLPVLPKDMRMSMVQDLSKLSTNQKSKSFSNSH